MTQLPKSTFGQTLHWMQATCMALGSRAVTLHMSTTLTKAGNVDMAVCQDYPEREGAVLQVESLRGIWLLRHIQPYLPDGPKAIAPEALARACKAFGAPEGDGSIDALAGAPVGTFAQLIPYRIKRTKSTLTIRTVLPLSRYYVKIILTYTLGQHARR